MVSTLKVSNSLKQNIGGIAHLDEDAADVLCVDLISLYED